MLHPRSIHSHNKQINSLRIHIGRALIRFPFFQFDYLLQYIQSMNQKLPLMLTLRPCPGSPARLVFTEHQAGQVAAPEVVEEAVFMVRVFRPGSVIAEVTALLILPTGSGTGSQARHRNKVV